MKRLALAALLSACGCTLLTPAHDVSRFYVLAVTAAPNATESSLALGVGPVRLPGYLAAPEVQVRASATELRRSQVDRWAEPLDEGIARVLAQDLSAELGTREVVLFPWYREQRPDVQVSLSVRRFELEPDGSALVEALFEVRDLASGRRALRDASLRRPAAAAGTAASIEALSQALGDLATQIAAEVRRLTPAPQS